MHLLRTYCENFRPRSLKVRSPGHVKRPDLRKSLNARHSYTEWPITLKLSAIYIRYSIYKFLSRNFSICDPMSGQFCDLSIISKWDKHERCLFWTKIIRKTLKPRFTGELDTPNWNIATSDPSLCRQGPFRSWKVTAAFHSAFGFTAFGSNFW